MNLFIDLHMHTHASAHAYSSAFEYIMEAKRKNMLAIAITDHGPALDDSLISGISLICMLSQNE